MGFVRMRSSFGLVLALAASGILLAAAPPPTARLEPRRRIAIEAKHHHASIAFPNDNEVLVGSAFGVTRISLKDGSTRTLVPAGEAPDGISRVKRVRTDGRTAAAFNAFEDYVVRLDDGKRLLSRRAGDFSLIDLVVSGDTIFALGNPVAADRSKLENPDGVVLWALPSGVDWRTSWRSMKPIHRLTGGATARQILLETRAPYGGALALEPDGSIWVSTAAEPGFYRYSKEGRLLEVLGHELDDLVIGRTHEAEMVHANDMDGRYGEVLNTQPILDDLVTTPDGPAAIVRQSTGKSLSWSLWFPGPEKLRAEFALSLERPGPFGHLACAARGSRIACLAGTPVYPDAKASEGSKAFEQKFAVVLFDLPRLPPAKKSPAAAQKP